MSDTQEQTTSETTALATVKAALPTIIAADTTDILGQLAKELSGFRPDISTRSGRDEIASKARKAATAKMDLIRLAKTLKDGHQKVLKGIIAEEKIITERMDGLRDSIRAPLTEFEQREERRVQAHQAALVELELFATIPDGWPSGHIATRLDELDSSELLKRDWEEFRDRASDACARIVDGLRLAHAAAVRREDEAAELERLRAEKAERDRLEAERQRVEREAEIARQAAEAARIAAEAEAARKAQEAEEVARREREATALAHMKAIRDAEEREQVAKLAAKAEREEAAKRDRLAAEALAKAERDKIEAAQTLERERAEAKSRAELASAEAERVKKIAAENAAKAERERQSREVKRLADEATARERNVAHRTKINREALAAMVLALDWIHPERAEGAKEIAKAIIGAIAKNKVPHCKMEY